MTQHNWTDERVERLKSLWAADVSCSQIAAELGGGVTRNAVIGKVHRMGLPGRKTSHQQLSADERRQRKNLRNAMRPKKARENGCKVVRIKPRTDWNAPIPNSPISLDIPLGDTNGLCKFIASDGDLCCGHKAHNESSWCEFHYRVVYTKPEARPDRRPFRSAA